MFFFSPQQMAQMMAQMNQGPSPDQGNEVPARVRVALEFLQRLTVKTGESVVPHGMGAESVPGQKLVKCEVDAQEAACMMLADYFRGTLEPTVWDPTFANEEEEHTCQPLPSFGMGKPYTITCPACNGQPQIPPMRCNTCHGRGTIGINLMG